MEQKREYSLEELYHLFELVHPPESTMKRIYKIQNLVNTGRITTHYAISILHSSFFSYLRERLDFDEKFDMHVYNAVLELDEYNDALRYLDRHNEINSHNLDLMRIDFNNISFYWCQLKLTSLVLFLNRGLSPINVVQCIPFMDNLDILIDEVQLLISLLDEYGLDWYATIEYNGQDVYLIDYVIMEIEKRINQNFDYRLVLLFFMDLKEKLKDPYVNEAMAELYSDVPMEIINLMNTFRYGNVWDEE